MHPRSASSALAIVLLAGACLEKRNVLWQGADSDGEACDGSNDDDGDSRDDATGIGERACSSGSRSRSGVLGGRMDTDFFAWTLRDDCPEGELPSITAGADAADIQISVQFRCTDTSGTPGLRCDGQASGPDDDGVLACCGNGPQAVAQFDCDPQSGESHNAEFWVRVHSPAGRCIAYDVSISTSPWPL